MQLCAELEGSLDYSPTTVNVAVTTNIQTLQIAIVSALANHPAAKADVLAALALIEHEGEPS